MELILASASQRRSELLRNCGYEFTVMPSTAPEFGEDLPASIRVERLAFFKALDVFRRLDPERRAGAVVLGADTLVTTGFEVFGKPKDEADAIRMLKVESGDENLVYTGIAVVSANGSHIDSDAALVKFADLDDEEIEAYVRTGDPMDKAGAYGIQGRFSAFIESISGSYFTVVGLPVHLVYRELKKFGILPSYIGRK